MSYLRVLSVSCVLCVRECQRSAAYLEAASFGGVQDEELFQQVLTVRGHVERNPVFTAQYALSQFLDMDKGMEKSTADSKNPPSNYPYNPLLSHP